MVAVAVGTGVRVGGGSVAVGTGVSVVSVGIVGCRSESCIRDGVHVGAGSVAAGSGVGGMAVDTGEAVMSVGVSMAGVR